MDIRQLRAWREKYLEKKNRERIFYKLDLAECINFAYVGSQPALKRGSVSAGYRTYKQWRNQLIRTIQPDTRPTWWEVVKKKNRAIKVG